MVGSDWWSTSSGFHLANGGRRAETHFCQGEGTDTKTVSTDFRSRREKKQSQFKVLYLDNPLGERLLAQRRWMLAETVGEWLSLVEHLVRDQGVGGSNPLSPTISS